MVVNGEKRLAKLKSGICKVEGASRKQDCALISRESHFIVGDKSGRAQKCKHLYTGNLSLHRIH